MCNKVKLRLVDLTVKSFIIDFQDKHMVGLKGGSYGKACTNGNEDCPGGGAGGGDNSTTGACCP